jgi:glycosyltransferase involved in cell wall biosynthesis
LHVLLSGPARGYVRAGLDRLGIPYVHRRLERYEDVAQLYHALDVYLVPSRQEGGPKSVLEAMASGVPIVSTRVGQATELVRDRVNGRLVDVEDVDALVDALTEDRLASSVAAGRETAAANCYEAQRPLWGAFFDGFVSHA